MKARAVFLLQHALLIPALFAASALVAHGSGFDDALTLRFFDVQTHAFAARDSVLLEALAHRAAKSAVLVLWLVLLAAAIASTAMRRLAQHRAVLWTMVAAMGIGPALVALLKDLNSIHCPWDLKRFGGLAEASAGWFVPAAEVGRCFPAGHAAGGFCIVAIAFAGLALGNRRLWIGALVAALFAGTAFSAVRIAQGAHFLSHNLWSAAIDWCLAALVFAPRIGLVDANAPAAIAGSEA